jgi:hypothetical protein
MLGFEKRPCGLCGARTRVRGAYRAPDRLNAFVCCACFEAWQRAGRQCPECHTAVTGMQDIGAFFDHHALGHADCGALRLFAA